MTQSAPRASGSTRVHSSRNPSMHSYPIVILCAIIILLAGVHGHTANLLYNGDFEADGGQFLIPVGWTPFGDAKHEGVHEDSWKAQLADALPGHDVGLYQIVQRAVPGARYRLTARVRTGNSQLPVRIGIVPKTSMRQSDVVWSEEHRGNDWTTLSVEAVADSRNMTIILQMRNINPQHPLFESSRWDDVSLTRTGTDTEPVTAQARISDPPLIPPAVDVYASMANLWSLAWPKTGVRTYLAGTHDPNPEGNADFDRFEGETDVDGETWTVLKSIEGAGAISRIWMTNFGKAGQIRIEVDGRSVEERSLFDFFGSPGNFHWPLTTKSSGGWMSYTPIPFTESARILVKDAGADRFYWQITYQLFRTTVGVRPFTNPINRTDTAHMAEIQDQWRLAGVNPKPAWPGARETSGRLSVPKGETVKLWSQAEPGMVDAIWLELPEDDIEALQGLRLVATWDRASRAQVNAPVGLFFGVGYERKIVRSLLMGMTPEGGYCYFPMPYRTANVELRNTTGRDMSNIRYRVRWVPLQANRLSPMRFHAVEQRDNRAGEGKLFIPLEVKGRGHFVGLSAAMARGNGNNMHFLEGDEYFWIDGEKSPSTAGTGTEDYFTCGWYFNQGPITLAPIGAPEVNHEKLRVSAYRLHVPDWVPFDRSFKFGLEVGNATSSSEYGDYSTVSYYYLETD